VTQIITPINKRRDLYRQRLKVHATGGKSRRHFNKIFLVCINVFEVLMGNAGKNVPIKMLAAHRTCYKSFSFFMLARPFEFSTVSHV
jgi:hypothetical protein